MARLNKKSTKDTIIKLLKQQEEDKQRNDYWGAEGTLRKLARELEIDIKDEDYK